MLEEKGEVALVDQRHDVNVHRLELEMIAGEEDMRKAMLEE